MFAEFGIEQEQQDHTITSEDSTETIDNWEDVDEQSDAEEEVTRQQELRVQRWAETVRGTSDSSDNEEKEETEVVQENSVKCSCNKNCMDSFSKEDVQEHVFSLREMEKNEKEMFIMASLQKYRNEGTRNGKRRRVRYRFMFGGVQVCKTVFCHVNDIGKKTLRAIIVHIGKNGAVPRIHGNVGKKPHNALHYEEVKFSVEFLLTHADIHGLPMPAAPRGIDDAPPIYLPCHCTKKDIHELYCRACDDASIRHLGLSSFKGVWQNCTPHIRIMSPKTDVCHRCQLQKNEISDAISEQEKLEATAALRNHVEVCSIQFSLEPG